jgi:hypothetical protein
LKGKKERTCVSIILLDTVNIMTKDAIMRTLQRLLAIEIFVYFYNTTDGHSNI